MKALKIIYSILFLLACCSNFSKAADFDFRKNGLRFSFTLAGNNDTTFLIPGAIKKTRYWSGNTEQLISPFNYGTFRYRLLNMQEETIFSRGFSPLYWEWQTTSQAKKTMGAYEQSVFFPYPESSVQLLIERRDFNGVFHSIYTTLIDPDDYHINLDSPDKVKVNILKKSGKYAKMVDVAIVAEGYTEKQMNKFEKDAARMMNYLMNTSPFDEYNDRFNFYAVKKASVEAGTDIPGDKIYKNTAFDSHFYTFDSPRYLTSSAMSEIYDAVESIPWDYIILLVNHERYGGGGFYNFLSICSADNSLSEFVFVHEFGHAFAGLGDEYYTSSTAYEEFYNLSIEPWEPNITSRVDFANKWKHLIHDTIPIPTPREEPYLESTGLFEGGGYMAKGMYSPAHDCIMKSANAYGFCEACKEGIRKMILFYTE